MTTLWNRKATVCGMVAALALAGCGGGGGSKRTPTEKDIRPPKPPPRVPTRVEMPIDESLRGRARLELQRALASKNPLIRANAIEGAKRSLGRDAKADMLKGLNDIDNGVRFAACMATGELQLAEARSKLLTMVDDPNARIRIGSRFALHRLGDTRLSQEFATYAADPRDGTRARTAMALGLLGEPTAIRILRRMMTDTSPDVRMEVATAMWRLKSEDGLEYLVGATLAQAPDDQIIAILALSLPQDRRVIEHVLGRLTSDYEEISLTAARGLGMLGSDEGLGVAVKYAKSVDARQRSLSALAMGDIGRSDSQPILAKLLTDKDDESVRLAAAIAILQLQPPAVGVRP